MITHTIRYRASIDNQILTISLQIPEDAILFPTERIVSALEFEGFGRRAQAEGVG